MPLPPASIARSDSEVALAAKERARRVAEQSFEERATQRAHEEFLVELEALEVQVCRAIQDGFRRVRTGTYVRNGALGRMNIKLLNLLVEAVQQHGYQTRIFGVPTSNEGDANEYFVLEVSW